MPKKEPKNPIILPDNVYKRFARGWDISQPASTQRMKIGKLVSLLRGSYDTIELIKYLISIYNVPTKAHKQLGEVIECANKRIIDLRNK